MRREGAALDRWSERASKSWCGSGEEDSEKEPALGKGGPGWGTSQGKARRGTSGTKGGQCGWDAWVRGSGGRGEAGWTVGAFGPW